jgi:dihydroorotase
LLCAQEYDLVLKGGHVVDPKNKISGRRDVAIKDGKIAEVGTNIAAAKAAKAIDVSGLYVTPGAQLPAESQRVHNSASLP